jgi:hypothetical protein
MQATAQSADRRSRIKRIRRRGCPQIIAALEREQLGIKTLERISRLPASKQAQELTRLVQEREAKAARQAAWRADPRHGKAVFASQSYAQARARRLRRIERTPTRELREAVSEERLSLRQYDQLSKLSPCQQRKAIKSDRHKERAQTLAAAAIRSVLAGNPQRIDLGLIAAQIITAIRGAPIRS